MSLNIFDYGIIIIVVMFFYRGYKSGLINQVTSLLAMICGIYFASEQYKIFADVIIKKFSWNPEFSQILAFTLLVVIVGLIINYLGHLLSEFLDLIFLSVVDDFAGAFFGLIKGIAIMYIFLLIIANIPIDFLQQQVSNSYFASILLDNLNPLFTQKIEKLIN
ncbi:MAG: CvpA family protein [Bacillota bacterium]